MDINERINEKNSFKKNINKIGIILLLDYIIVFGVESLIMLYLKADVSITKPQFEQLFAISSIPVVVIASTLVYLLCDKNARANIFRKGKNKMSIKTLLLFIGITLLIKLVSARLTNILELIFNQFGYTIASIPDLARGQTQSIFMIIFIALIMPFNEELLFRGVMLRMAEKYGKIFTIVFTSILFAIVHGNVPQMVFTFMFGILLGYICFKYSIYWAFFIHVINNFAFSYLLMKLINKYGNAINNYLMLFLLVVSGITLVKLFKIRDKIWGFIRNNGIEKKYYFYAFTSITIMVISFIAIMTIVFSVKAING